MSLTPFSYVILVLVGRNGAGPHDLRRMAEADRVFWSAAPSQWYAEPKRLEKLGLLAAQRLPGRTRQRTHYELTEAGRAALADWVTTPAPLPRIQNEAVVRLLAADLVDPTAVAQGLAPLAEALEEATAAVAVGEEVAATIPYREKLLLVNHHYARRLLELQAQWLAEAQAVLADSVAP